MEKQFQSLGLGIKPQANNSPAARNTRSKKRELVDQMPAKTNKPRKQKEPPILAQPTISPNTSRSNLLHAIETDTDDLALYDSIPTAAATSTLTRTTCTTKKFSSIQTTY